jgi:hypothetical protein
MAEEALLIHDIYDLERILIERPDWKERIRKLILTEELMNLPQKFDQFVEERHAPLEKKVDKIERDVETLKEDVKSLKDEMAEVKGDLLELKIEKRAAAYLGRFMRKVKVFDHHKLNDHLIKALDEGLITDEEHQEALRIDLIVVGKLIKKPAEDVLVGLEISYRADRRDVERAYQRVQILKKALKKDILPVVYGKKFTRGAREMAEKLGVLLLD